jgi:hypothetical protein
VATRASSGVDFDMWEEDFIACEMLGGDEMVWKGVAEAVGLRWSDIDHGPSIALGFAEHMRDERD